MSYEKIDDVTKRLLIKKNWQNPNSLEELGYVFFGPIIFNFFCWLKTESIGCDKILFNSREGYFLKQIADTFNDWFKLPERVYFKTSRKLSFMISFFEKDDVYNSFKLHKYKGEFKDMMLNRFNIITEENFKIDTTIQLPDLDSYIEEILNNSKRIRDEYFKYVMKSIGDSKNVIMVDNGYQGSTQYNIEKTYDLKFKGRYFTYNYANPLSDTIGFFDFDNTHLKDNFIFFESVFIDKVGSFVDILDGKFINENLTANYFTEKQKIIKGIKFFIKDILKESINMETFSYKFSDYLFHLMCSDGFIINNSLFESFIHDNTYTRNFTKKINRR